MPSDPSHPIKRSDLLKIHYLNLSRRNIQHLDGIELVPKLVSIDLSYNRIKNLESLKDLAYLREINLSKNGITDLEKAGFDHLLNTPLLSLDLSHNGKISSSGEIEKMKDIQLLQNLTTLEELNLMGNHIQNIAPLEKLSNLRSLNLRENLIQDLTPLSNLSKLKYLNIHSNSSIHSIRPLQNLSQLETFIAPNIHIGNEIEIISNMENLKRLNLRNTGITDFSILGDILKLGMIEEIDLRLNHSHEQSIANDFFAPIRPFWGNITFRYPQHLPDFNILPPRFSHPAGFYSNHFLLSLESKEGYDIYYTLDGSVPDPQHVMDNETWASLPRETRSRTYLYSNPIDLQRHIERELDISTLPTNFLDLIEGHEQGLSFWHLPWKKPDDDTPKALVVKAISIKNNYPSRTKTNTYFFQSSVEYKNLPVISISTDRSHLFDHDYGIYVPGAHYEHTLIRTGNFAQRGKQWERIGYFEYFDQQGLRALHQKTGLRIHGKGSRSYPQKSLRIYPQKNYASYPLNYPFFNSKKNDVYYNFILRNAGQDASHGLMRDAIMQSLVRHLSIDTQHYQPTIVFINGEYWGIHNLRDRFDHYYVHTHHKLPLNNISILESFLGRVTTYCGEPAHVHDFLTFAHQLNTGQYESLNCIDQYIALHELLDYVVTHFYAVNSDWPTNNIKFWRYFGPKTSSERGPFDGRWRWFLFDLDFSLGRYFLQKEDQEFNMFHFVLDEKKFPSLQQSMTFFQDILGREEVLNEFIQRVAIHLNTTFHPDRVTSTITEHKSVIEPEIKTHYKRWKLPCPETWNEEINIMIDFAHHRPERFRNQLIDYFEDISGSFELNIHGLDTADDIIVHTIPLSKDGPGVYIDDGKWSGFMFSGAPLVVKSEKTDLTKIRIESNKTETIEIIEQKQNKIVILVNEPDEKINLYLLAQ